MEIQRQRHQPDAVLILTVAILLAVGIVMVYSASVVRAQEELGDGLFYLKRQALFAGIGLVAMYACSMIHYWHWARWSKPILIIGIVLLVLVLVPGLGIERNGAQRWLGFGPAPFQPSEFMKFAMVLFVADYMTRRRDKLRTWRGFLPPLPVLGLVLLLIMGQPDMGTAMSVAATVFLMLYIGGVSVLHLGGLGLVGAATAVYYAFSAEYRRERILNFLDPWRDPLGDSYQVIQGLLALASGGLFGVGLGRSRQKFFYLPEPHTDYIFAIIGEELGFLGAAVVVLLFLLFAWRGYLVAVNAPDRFSSLLAAGVTTMIIVQGLMNLAVVTASMPATGIPLPLISSGGSSLVVTLMGVGLLLGVSRYTVR